MDEFCDEMGIEMNYANPDDHVTEAKSNNKVIKGGFDLHTIDCPLKKHKGL